MSETAGGGESGGATGAGQDPEGDNEPPHQAPPLPEGDGFEVGATLDEGATLPAKRPRISEEEQGLEQVVKPVEMLGETPAQVVLLQEDPASPAQSRVFSSACIK